MFVSAHLTVFAVQFHWAADLYDFHFASLTKLHDRRRREAVGDEDIDFRKVRDTHRRGPRELAAVGDEDDFTRMLDDGPRYFHLANVKIQQGAGLIDRRCADDREINAKLFNLLDGHCPDNAPVAL